MREILFRGKRADNDEWIYGGYVHKKNSDTYIVTSTIGTSCKCEINNMIVTAFSVDLETVGQFTGFTDDNGVKIFEGDIVASRCMVSIIAHGWYLDTEIASYAESEPFSRCYGWYSDEIGTYDQYGLTEYDCTDITIIGNVYDNPELLRGD